ncbi:class I SAM-dependent methyltransferase [Zongyangia hominis]|uniref:Class I SAM-dependent methyltransferase n=1 Tax=Zongyangia hominis TaxID=2763677 RepID=A0A926EE31_9FIRM|nr:class I SAM-dependent methyltransferase [Zongyangia hominis]MBC8570411.1 class I SAM-dependent methyltransferase [Zongyangia hominis]
MENKIQAYFDALAPRWDQMCSHDQEKIHRILDACAIAPTDRVLDIACGTGVLAPYLRERNPAAVTAIDLSPQMIARAREKHPEGVRFLCGDVLELRGETFDVCIVYSAFPHFLEPERLIQKAWELLSPGGRLVVAHSQSRAQINAVHGGSASEISMGLMEASRLQSLMEPLFTVTERIDNEEMYLVRGVK